MIATRSKKKVKSNDVDKEILDDCLSMKENTIEKIKTRKSKRTYSCKENSVNGLDYSESPTINKIKELKSESKSKVLLNTDGALKENNTIPVTRCKKILRQKAVHKDSVDRGEDYTESEDSDFTNDTKSTVTHSKSNGKIKKSKKPKKKSVDLKKKISKDHSKVKTSTNNHHNGDNLNDSVESFYSAVDYASVQEDDVKKDASPVKDISDEDDIARLKYILSSHSVQNKRSLNSTSFSNHMMKRSHKFPIDISGISPVEFGDSVNSDCFDSSDEQCTNNSTKMIRVVKSTKPNNMSPNNNLISNTYTPAKRIKRQGTFTLEDGDSFLNSDINETIKIQCINEPIMNSSESKTDLLSISKSGNTPSKVKPNIDKTFTPIVSPKSQLNLTHSVEKKPHTRSERNEPGENPNNNLTLNETFEKVMHQKSPLKLNETYEKERQLGISEKDTKLNETFEKDKPFEIPENDIPKLNETFEKEVREETIENNSKLNLKDFDESLTSKEVRDKRKSRVSFSGPSPKFNTCKTSVEQIVKSSLKDAYQSFCTDTENTPIRRKSVCNPGSTPYHLNSSMKSRKSAIQLNLTHSIEKDKLDTSRASIVKLSRQTRVAFCSPTANISSINNLAGEKIIKSSMKGSNRSFIYTEKEKAVPRKRSFTHNDAEDIALMKRKKLTLEEQNASANRLSGRLRTPSKQISDSPTLLKCGSKSTPSKKSNESGIKRAPLSRSKLPDFAALHRRQFEQMESLDDCQKRKQERATRLLLPLSAKKSINTIEDKNDKPKMLKSSSSAGLKKRLAPINKKNKKGTIPLRSNLATAISNAVNLMSPKDMTLTRSIMKKSPLKALKRVANVNKITNNFRAALSPAMKKKIMSPRSAKLNLTMTGIPVLVKEKLPLISRTADVNKEKNKALGWNQIKKRSPIKTKSSIQTNADSVQTKTKINPTLTNQNCNYTRFGYKVLNNANIFNFNAETKSDGAKPPLRKSGSKDKAKKLIMRTSTDSNDLRNKNKALIKGVRSNRRFELQMKSRNLPL